MRISKALVSYFGMIQGLHFIALVRAGSIYLTEGRIGFPAPPPAQGWPEAAIPFLIALGTTDAILIVSSELFVLGFFRSKTWAYKTGLIALAGSSATALVFALGTLPFGAWAVHPLQYGLLVALFTPFIRLFQKLIIMKPA